MLNPTQTGRLCRIEKIAGTTLTLKVDDLGDVVAWSDFGNRPTVRRWDGTFEVKDAVGAFFELGSERIEVELSAGSYRKGDWWQIPARTSTSSVAWPEDQGIPTPQLPEGRNYRYMRLAALNRTNGTWTVTDCRPMFPLATQRLQLLNVGGGAQRGPMGAELPFPLQVAVLVGHHPAVGAPVEFTPSSGELSSASGGPYEAALAPLEVRTNATGIATVYWRTGTDTASQSVIARLKGHVGETIGPPAKFDFDVSPRFWVTGAALVAVTNPTNSTPIELAPDHSGAGPSETTVTVPDFWSDTNLAPNYYIECTIQGIVSDPHFYHPSVEVLVERALPNYETTVMRGTLTATPTLPDPAVGVNEWVLRFTPIVDATETSFGPVYTTSHRIRVRVHINATFGADAADAVAEWGHFEFTYEVNP